MKRPVLVSALCFAFAGCALVGCGISEKEQLEAQLTTTINANMEAIQHVEPNCTKVELKESQPHHYRGRVLYADHTTKGITVAIEDGYIRWTLDK